MSNTAAQRFFAHIRKMIEPLAARLGDRRLKEACCQLVLDDGTGFYAGMALRNLQSVSFHVGDLETATNLLARHLARAGAR